jgi:hypothetical protein
MTGLAALLVAHGTNYTAIIISVGIIFIVGAVIAVVVASYFRLQGHRADTVAMAPTASRRKRPWRTRRNCGTGLPGPPTTCARWSS